MKPSYTEQLEKISRCRTDRCLPSQNHGNDQEYGVVDSLQSRFTAFLSVRVWCNYVNNFASKCGLQNRTIHQYQYWNIHMMSPGKLLLKRARWYRLHTSRTLENDDTNKAIVARTNIWASGLACENNHSKKSEYQRRYYTIQLELSNTESLAGEHSLCVKESKQNMLSFICLLDYSSNSCSLKTTLNPPPVVYLM